jgi:hypothetical protein
MRQQKALTIITRLKPDRNELRNLGRFLGEIGNDIKKNPHVQFDRIGTTCFASWILLDNDPHYPPALVFECNYEGELDDYLDQFVGNAGPALHRIYQHCLDYKAQNKNDDAYLKEFLKAHRQDYAAFYIGCPYQSQRGILEAIRARHVIEKCLGPQSKDSDHPLQLRRNIEQHLQRESIGSFDGLITPLEKLRTRVYLNVVLLVAVILALGTAFYSVALSILGGDGIAFLAVLIIAAVPILGALLVIRIKEIREPKTQSNGTARIDPRLFHIEDRFPQNHLTTLVEIKPGRFRLYTLRVVLWQINLLARLIFITGHLGGIPTIHFARWLIIDTDRPVQRLLFLSNFDGSWHSYLGDFVDKAAFGLNGIWGNTVEFPPTRFLFWKGAHQIVEFKQWSRDHNLFAHVWYSAYRDITVKNVLNNVTIADKIGKDLDLAETTEWLSLL